MSRTLPLMLSLVVAFPATILPAAPASADAALTPTLTPRARHIEAELELRDLVAVLPDEARLKVAGIYVAFVPTPVDVMSQAACDDDGDDVIVLSDAMLVLLENVSHAQARDVGASRTNLLSLASLYAKDQRPGERLLPPVHGAFETSDSRATEIVHTARFREALSGVLAHELSIFVRGELACAHPTATRERGDDVWTAEEAEMAREIATRVYAAPRTRQRDRDAVALVHASKGETLGYVGWLSFLGALASQGGHPGWSYLQNHPDAVARAANVERDVEEARAEAHRRAHGEP